MENHNREDMNDTNKNVLQDLINILPINDDDDIECKDIKIIKIIKNIEDTYFSPIDLRNMFKHLKKETNNFSENILNLEGILIFYQYDINTDINGIIEKLNKLFLKFYLNSTECKKVNKSFETSFNQYKTCEKETIVTIKKIWCFKTKFMEQFSLLLEDCYKKEQHQSYFFYEDTKENNKYLIVEIIKDYKKLNNNLSLFLFFLNEIDVIFQNLGINISFLNFIKKKYENIKNIDLLFLKHIFKDNSESVFEFLFMKFGKDNRDLNYLLRLFLLKTIVNYFREINDIEKFIDGLENIKQVHGFYSYDINILLKNIKEVLHKVFNRIMLNKTNINYKAFLYMLMLYLLILNIPDILKLKYKYFDGNENLDDFYFIKNPLMEIRISKKEHIDMFLDFFNIDVIYKLIVTETNYNDILLFEKEVSYDLEEIILKTKTKLYNYKKYYKEINEIKNNMKERNEEIDEELDKELKKIKNEIDILINKLKQLDEKYLQRIKKKSDFMDIIQDEIENKQKSFRSVNVRRRNSIRRIEKKKRINNLQKIDEEEAKKSQDEEEAKKIREELEELLQMKENLIKEHKLKEQISSLRKKYRRRENNEEIKKEIIKLREEKKYLGDEILIKLLLPLQQNQDVIKELKLLDLEDMMFYLDNNVRNKEDIIKFLKLIKEFLPSIYDELKVNEYNIYDVDDKSTSIQFSPSKNSPPKSTPQIQDIPIKQSIFNRLLHSFRRV